MSGVFAALTDPGAYTDRSWQSQLDSLVSRSKQRGNDGTRVLLAEPSEFRSNGVGDKLRFDDYELSPSGLIGCAYSRPMALDEEDPGPFHGEDLAIAYDGIVSQFTGDQLVKYLETNDVISQWETVTGRLNGQFSLIAISKRRSTDRIYYTVKAKPLYLLFDSLHRGIIVSSSLDALRGMYHPVRNPSPVRLEPYTSGHVTLSGRIFERASLIEYPGEGTLVLCGGGLDSLVASFSVKAQYARERMQLLYFDYGAKAAVPERMAVSDMANSLRDQYPASQTDTDTYSFPLLSQIAVSSLTDPSRPVSIAPQAGKASEWFPARNTVLLSLGLAYAEAHGYARIVTGINQDAAAAYPDNDGEWLHHLRQVVPYAIGTSRQIRLMAPLANMSKVDIVKHGESLGVPWERSASWSCYGHGAVHCGLCSSCRSRRKAFQLAKVHDPTVYAI